MSATNNGQEQPDAHQSGTGQHGSLSHGAQKKFVEAEMAAGSADSWAKIQERKRKQQKAAKRAKRAARQQTAQHQPPGQPPLLPGEPPLAAMLDPSAQTLTQLPDGQPIDGQVGEVGESVLGSIGAELADGSRQTVVPEQPPQAGESVNTAMTLDVNLDDDGGIGNDLEAGDDDPTLQQDLRFDDEDPDATAATMQQAPRSPVHDRNSLAGRKFGKYDIVRELARGGMGIVYQAQDPDLRREVALKVMIAGEHASERALQSFKREARAVAHLKHPNLINVLDAGEADGLHYFTMDFVRGRELKDVLKDGPDLRQVIAWIVDVCKGLDYAHSNGVIHRDLKPANIMIDKDGTPLVMDFGLARDDANNSIQSVSGNIAGTPAYMSPEQAQGKVDEMNGHTDIFSMGVILYEVCTGERAFSGNTLVETLQAVVNDHPMPVLERNPSIDLNLSLIIEHCLEKDQDRRYATMLHLANDLSTWIAGNPISLRPESIGQKLARIAKQQWKMMAVAALALIAAGALSFVLLGGNAWLKSQYRLIRSQEPDKMAAAVHQMSLKLGEAETSAALSDELRQMLRALLGGPVDEQALQALVQHQDPATARLLIGDFQRVDEPTRLRYLLALIDLPQAEGARINPADFASRDDSVAQQQAALAVAQKYQKDQGRAFARRLAKDEQRAIPLRTAAIRIMADHLQVTNSQQLLDLMRLSAHENQQIAQAAHQALQQRRNSDAILAQYGVGASARAAERGAARLVAISEQRNQEINALLNGEPSPRTKKNSEDPLEAMASRLRTGAANERLMAAYDIGQLGDPRGVPVVVPALADQDPGVRRVALRSLRHLAEKRRPTPADIIPLFKEKDFLVRATAARAFAQLNIDDPDGVLLAQYADEHQEVVRIALLEALGALGGPDRLRVIDAAAGNPDRSRAERQAALLALTMKKCHAGATAETVLQFLVADDKEFAGLVHQALVQEFGDDYGTGYDGREAWQAVIAGKEPPVIQQQP